MEVSQKEIVLAPFPFSNLKSYKVRPAIVVSNNHINQMLEDCIILPLTSIIRDEPYSVIIHEDDLSEGSLDMMSRVKADTPATIDKRLILKKIGIINDNAFCKIREEIIKTI